VKMIEQQRQMQEQQKRNKEEQRQLRIVEDKEDKLRCMWDRREWSVRMANPVAKVTDPRSRAIREAFEQSGPSLLGLREFREALIDAPKFDEAETTMTFKQHLRELCIHAVIYAVLDDSQRKFLLFFSLKGQSADRTEHLAPGSPTYDETLRYDKYEQHILEVFHPLSERNLARLKFIARKQFANRDMSSNFSAKQVR